MTTEQIMEFQHRDRIDSAKYHIEASKNLWMITSHEAAMLWVGKYSDWNTDMPICINCALSEVDARKYPPGPGINTLCMDEVAQELLTRFEVYGIEDLSDDLLEELHDQMADELFARFARGN